MNFSSTPHNNWQYLYLDALEVLQTQHPLNNIHILCLCNPPFHPAPKPHIFPVFSIIFFNEEPVTHFQAAGCSFSLSSTPCLSPHPNHLSQSSSLPERALSSHCLFSAILSLISTFQSLPTHQPIHSSRTVSLSDKFDHVILSPCSSNLWKPSIIYKYKFQWCGLSSQVLVLLLFQPLFLPCLSIYAFSKAYSKEREYLGGAPLLKSFRVRTRTTQPTLSHSWIVKRSVSTF